MLNEMNKKISGYKHNTDNIGLINDTLYPALEINLRHKTNYSLHEHDISGLEHIDKVIKIDQETKRISCGIKQMHPDPYENLEKKYKVGKIYDGTVTKIVDYGAFVKLQEGLEGLVHQSSLSWTKKKYSPK